MTTPSTGFQVLSIAAPEGVRFTIPLAGPAIRFLAWLIDALVISSAFGVVTQTLSVFEALNRDFTVALLILFYFSLNIGYPILMEWMWRGQSVGKKLFGLRVIDAGGGRLEFNQILLRNLLRFVDSLPIFYLVGGVSLVLSGQGQRLGDLAANTVVIRRKKLPLPESAHSLTSGQFNSLLTHPHLAARLRQQVPVPLAHIALEAILRRDELLPEARVAVFSLLARKFKDLINFPDETIAGLADERYVRNCLQIVLNTGNLHQHVYSRTPIATSST